MKQKLPSIFILAAVLLFALFARAQEILQSKDIYVDIDLHPAATVMAAPASWSLVEKIQEGKSLLSHTPPLLFEKEVIKTKTRQGKIITKEGDLARRQLELAILDTYTSAVFSARYWLDEKEIEEANTIRKLYLYNVNNIPRFQPVEASQFNVKVNWWNYYNSDLDVAAKNGDYSRYIVLANKFLLKNDSLVYPEDKKGKEYSEIIYVPYSPDLHTKELVEAGKKFLDNHVAEAFERLRNKGVKSRTYSSQSVTDTMTPAFVKNIFTTEQTDPKLILASSDGGQALAERVLIRLGANGEKAFRYTFSKTGALGLGQIMPRTYASIVKGYPPAGLIKDKDIGRVDIVNSIMASVLVLDDHLSTVASKAKRNTSHYQIFSSKSSLQIEEIRAAIYNGGPGKYIAATGEISQKVRETVDFVKKFKMIRGLGLY